MVPSDVYGGEGDEKGMKISDLMPSESSLVVRLMTSVSIVISKLEQWLGELGELARAVQSCTAPHSSSILLMVASMAAEVDGSVALVIPTTIEWWLDIGLSQLNHL